MSFKNGIITLLNVVVLSLMFAVLYTVSSGIFMATAAEYAIRPTPAPA